MAREPAKDPETTGPAPVDAARAVLAAVTAFATVAVLDFAYASASGGVFDAGAGAALEAAMHLLGVGGALGLFVGVFLALIAPPWAKRGPAVLGAVSRGSDAPPKARIELAARLTAGAASALPALASAFWAGGYAHDFTRGDLAAAFVTVAVGAGLLVAALVFVPVRDQLVRAFEERYPSGHIGGWPLPALVLLCWLFAALALAVVLAHEADLRVFRHDAAATVLGALGLALLLLAKARQRAPIRPDIASVVLLVTVMLSLGWAAVDSSGPTSSRLLNQDSRLGRVAMPLLRGTLDFDGDGHSALFGGGDCDDANPDVGPHRSEIPGNGVDDNCRGGDAELTSAGLTDAGLADAGPTAAPGSRPNMLILLVDTVRADHVGSYGYERETTPQIDAFAEGAVVFERAWAQAPNTPRSFPSMITSRHPSRIAWANRYGAMSGFRPDHGTLFGALAEAGYRVEGVSAHMYFGVPNVLHGVSAWDNEGAVDLRSSMAQSTAPEVTRRAASALRRLAAGDAPFCLFVHLFEPHAAYLDHPELRAFGPEPMDRYDSEIAFADHHVGVLIEALERHGIADDTVVTVLSDHGEAFGEHGLELHGRTLYEEEVRVPLVLRVPGVAPRRVDTPVALLDLTPTLLGLAGLALSDAEGRDLGPLLRGREAEARLVFAEQIPYTHHRVHLVSATDGHFKAIRNLTTNVLEVFDLALDAGETRDLRATNPNAQVELVAALDHFLEGDPGPPSPW